MFPCGNPIWRWKSQVLNRRTLTAASQSPGSLSNKQAHHIVVGYQPDSTFPPTVILQVMLRTDSWLYTPIDCHDTSNMMIQPPNLKSTLLTISTPGVNPSCRWSMTWSCPRCWLPRRRSELVVCAAYRLTLATRFMRQTCQVRDVACC